MVDGNKIRVLWSTALTRLNRESVTWARSRGQSSRIPTPKKVSTLRKQKPNGSLQVFETSLLKKKDDYFTPRVKVKTLDAFFLKHDINRLGISCC